MLSQLQLKPSPLKILNSHCNSRKLFYSARPPFNKSLLITSSTTHRFSSLEHKLKLSRPINHTRFVCTVNDSDMTSQLELERPDGKGQPRKPVNGVFWIILLNLGVFVADHLLLVEGVKSLYLYHRRPAWYQFVTATFCHANWNHLSSNLFFLYIFGKLVEEEEGNFGLWLCYILTGAGANLFSWLILPRNAISVEASGAGANLFSWLILPRNAISIGASGAVFGLFTISVLVKMSWNWRKILEVLILGQFVIERVMEAAQASTALPGAFRAGYALQSINHIAHLSGALVGVVLVWLLSSIPSQPPEEKLSALGKKDKRTL